MKVLWITNILFPEAQEVLTNSEQSIKSSGGWMLASAEAIVRNDGIQLYIATVSRLVKKLTVLQVGDIVYYVVPYGKGNLIYNRSYEKFWVEIRQQILPDIVHIHGTEFTHGLAYLRSCGNNNVVISIQGMVSVCADYYYAGITRKEVLNNLTFHDLIKGGIVSDMNSFRKRGEYEKEMIQRVKHVIGRTSWDRSHTWGINPNVTYHFCNESLRSEFYGDSCWDYATCSKHSIFLSQAGYPIKGLHQVLKAMPLILQHYPDTRIRVAGVDITKSNGFYGLLHFTSYGKYIKRLIEKYGLGDKIVFTGNLDAEQMKQEYLKANVFICPSSIENSPNSLGEAQILGVPCLASYVGGIPDMMKGNESNLYRFEEVEMLAEKVCNVFAAEVQQKNMIIEAFDRHDSNKNNLNLVNIYKEICK